MNRNIVITGASRGIGLAAAEAFLREGDRVLAHFFRHGEPIEALKARYPGQVFGVCADLADKDAHQVIAAEAQRVFSHVDVLVNNAGIARQELFLDMTPQGLAEMWQINVAAPMLLTQSLLPGMLERRAGCVINVSSIWGREGASCEVAYSAAKAALIGFTQALSKEVGLMGVRVNAVAPGVIETDMCAHLTDDDRRELAEQTSLGRLGSAADAAGAILLLASPHATYITGTVLPVDGGFMG